jgi:hypothetical protein
MLDPVCCQQLTEEAQARIAVSALCELRELIDNQSWLATPREVEASEELLEPQEVPMRDRSVGRPMQRTLTFDRSERWKTVPELVQRRCGDLIGQLLRAVLQGEATTRSHDERQDSARSS